MGLDIVEIFKNIFIFSCCETSKGRLKKKDSYSRVKVHVHVVQSLVFVNIMPLIISLT